MGDGQPHEGGEQPGERKTGRRASKIEGRGQGMTPVHPSPPACPSAPSSPHWGRKALAASPPSHNDMNERRQQWQQGVVGPAHRPVTASSPAVVEHSLAP